MFKNKKILFFAANFFGYQLEIKNKLEELGAQVHFYDERPKNTFWYKALIRVDKRLISQRINTYYQNILDVNKNEEFDYVFFLKAEVITERMLKEYRKHNAKSKFILYMWDSIDNCKSVKKLLPHFDKILSFDRLDSNTYNNIQFRPLFYLDDYSKINQYPLEYNYDLTFIGTGHTDRYRLLKKIETICNKNKLKSYFFIYLQDLRIFTVRKLVSPDFKTAKKDDFSFTPLTKREIIEIIEDSRVVLDIERSVQCGLTMRTIEVLGASRKLITTNKDIINYDIYHVDNVCVIDRDDPVIPISFFEVPFKKLEESITARYNLHNWLNEVFL